MLGRIVPELESDSAPNRRRPTAARTRLFAALGILGFALALGLVLQRQAAAPTRARFTAGASVTSRSLILRSFAGELERHGLAVELIESADTLDELDAVQARRVDFALVSSALELHRLHPELREVTPLFDEALHLLVRPEHAPAFAARGLEALRGLRVDLGSPRSATTFLAEEVLRFAKVPCAPEPDPDHCGALRLPLDALLVPAGGRAPADLPDAVFHLGAVPSRIAQRLIVDHGYMLVPLPFADSFRLGALLSDEDGDGSAEMVERRSTLASVLPPFLYGTSPPIPASPLPTIGAGLVLVAHRDLSPALVEQVVETALESRFARVLDPALDRGRLRRPAPLPLHAGTHAYLARERPLVAASDVDRLANSLSVVGAVVGGALFAWQSWRQRARAALDARFTGQQLEIAAIERRIAELELAAQLELEPLAEIQRALLELKSDALARFAAGELGDQTRVGDLLAPINAARDHVAKLILHVRDGLEDEARRQGRSAESVWAEAIEGGEADGAAG